MVIGITYRRSRISVTKIVSTRTRLLRRRVLFTRVILMTRRSGVRRPLFLVERSRSERLTILRIRRVRALRTTLVSWNLATRYRRRRTLLGILFDLLMRWTLLILLTLLRKVSDLLFRTLIWKLRLLIRCRRILLRLLENKGNILFERVTHTN